MAWTLLALPALDIRMPRLDGLEATRRLAARDVARPRVLILTTFEHDDLVLGALRAGAAGFLAKRAAPEEIVEAIGIVAAGQSVLFPARLAQLVREELVPARSRAAQELVATLTPREHDVLAALGRGQTNQEIAAALVVTVETVKSHVSSVLLKLGARDRTQAAIVAVEAGLDDGGEPSGALSRR